MRRFMAAVALCAAPTMAFATAASASGDYPPDDSEVETETSEVCAESATAAGDTGTVAGETGNTNDPGESDPGGSDDTASTAGDDPDCSHDTPRDTTDDDAAAGIATPDPRAAAEAEGQLPATGGDTAMFVRIAAMSVIAGGAFVLVAWWRKRPSPA